MGDLFFLGLAPQALRLRPFGARAQRYDLPHMPERYVAFLSYAHRYQPWVQVLQRNLEAGRAAAYRGGMGVCGACRISSCLQHS